MDDQWNQTPGGQGAQDPNTGQQPGGWTPPADPGQGGGAPAQTPGWTPPAPSTPPAEPNPTPEPAQPEPNPQPEAPADPGTGAPTQSGWSQEDQGGNTGTGQV